MIVTGSGGPDVLSLGEADIPTPGPGDLMVEVVAAGVNRADLLQRQGRYPPPRGASDILGLEVAGTVSRVGDGVAGWSVGEPCVALLAGGGYAEYVAVPAGQAIRPPTGMDLVRAAGVLEVAATVVSNLDQAGLAADDAFLVHGGAGGIGSFAIQYARALGARVATTAGSAAKLSHCRELGAELALSYRGDWPAEIRGWTGGRGLDVVLDNMGALYLEDHVRLLAPHGRLVIIGMQGGARATLDLGALMARWGTVTATTLRSRSSSEKAAICAAVAQRVWPLIAAGAITVAEPTTYPLADAAAAHEHLESGDNVGKIVLQVR